MIIVIQKNTTGHSLVSMKANPIIMMNKAICTKNDTFIRIRYDRGLEFNDDAMKLCVMSMTSGSITLN